MAPAQFSVGAAYAAGREVPKDEREAVRWYRLSAEQNYAPAQLKLGAAYVLGDGVTRKPCSLTSLNFSPLRSRLLLIVLIVFGPVP